MPTAVMDHDVSSYRLPRTAIPERYEIRLTPDLAKAVFKGEETIHLTVTETVQKIIVNAIELNVESVSIESDSEGKVTGAVSLDEPLERAAFTFEKPIKPGKWRLKIIFAGILNDKLRGFYRSTYKDPHGDKKYIATTQFEATDARRAFPCFDEPDFKAVFKVTLVVDSDLTAISNAAVESETPDKTSGKKEVVFKETMKMSTYLVAFIVGDFEATKVKMVDGTPLRLFSPPGKLNLTAFSMESAAHSLSFFNNYYGIKYPGDKLELIAVPDFAFGAMENLGAVIFRENALLVDESNATHAELERVADVVAHEIAHMWFGDLTTMKWWNGIWLNEAFATFMEMLAVDDFKKNWKRWDTFGVSRSQAFATDSLTSTRTIEFPVRHPAECEAMFDILTYEKGCSVLRMLEQYLGAETFRKGISRYLDKHKYANTETTDLWDAIEESSKQPVRQLMDSWIFQQGHPMVTVEMNKERTAITFKQERFLFASDKTEGNKADKERATLFHVPIMVKARIVDKTGQDEIVTKKFLLTQKSKTWDLIGEINRGGATIDWLIVNEGGHGFYRVKYDEGLLAGIKKDMHTKLSAIERFNLVSDSWAAVLADMMPLSEYLKLLKLFSEEKDKNVWTIITSSLTYLERVVEPASRPQLSALVHKIISPAFMRLGYDAKAGEDALSGQLRAMLLSQLGTLGEDKAAQDKAQELYAKYKADRNSVSPDMVPAIVAILAHVGDQKRYAEFVEEWSKAASPQEEDRYMYALAAFQDKNLLEQTLAKTISGEVRTQNAPYLMRAVMLNQKGRELAWQFMKLNFQKMVAQYPNNSIGRMCEGIGNLATDEMLKDVREFFAANEVKHAKKPIEQHMEKLAVAVSLKKREKSTLGCL